MTKIDKLQIKNHFIQIDTVEGFSYLDRIGKIINKFYNEKAPVTNFAIENSPTRELVILKPTEDIEELHVNHHKLYIAANGDKIKENTDYISRIGLEIIELIDVDKIKRIGLRFYNRITDENLKKNIKEKLLSNNSNIGDFSIVLNQRAIGDYEYNMKISSAKDGLDNIILFDIDIFKKAEINKQSLSKEMKSLSSFVESDNFIDDINKALNNE